tara:strand:+ start:529 stop:1314 length:786 start_codon:yes stop_codon:yes gene_type:complete
MLAIIYSDWYYGIGQLHKLDGKPYATKHGAFRKHPCTIWAAESYWNLSWLISHGMALCDEYTARYNKVHACQPAITEAITIFEASFDFNVDIYKDSLPMSFTRAMPEFIKFDTTIDSITAYKRYLNTKPWLATNYLRIPSRKPSFITTMTTSTPNTSDLPVFDFSNEPSQVEVEQAKSQAYQSDEIQKAIEDAEKAMKAPSAKPLVPTKKATKKSGKAGRIVGISKDENEYIQEVLQMIADDPELGSSNPNYAKIQARYNK